jgi:Tol biopolymer transport system component
MLRQWGRPIAATLIASAACAGLVVVPVAGATSPGENGPIVWNSQAVVNGSGDDEIWIMDPDGSNKNNLTNNTVSDQRPAISPNGQKVAFMSFRQPNGESGNSELYVMNVDGSDQTALTATDSGFEAEPSWSPDSETIVWTRTTPQQDIWTTSANGSNKTNLTNTALAYECCPEYSPDGTRIAFTNSGDTDGNEETPGDENEIWVMDANGSNPVQLTDPTDTDDTQDLQPTWSPDGSRIAWIKFVPGAQQLWTMDADGANQAALVATGYYYSPTWSPDGGLIAVGLGTEIVAVDVDTPTSITNLTNDGAIQDQYPSWAPAGGGGAAPNTKITDGPPDVVHKPKATFKFKAVPATGATFECKLDDKPFKTCESPKTYRRLSRGKHKFQARASNSEGTDPTPAKASFKYKP